jgi:hypothetical protein
VPNLLAREFFLKKIVEIFELEINPRADDKAESHNRESAGEGEDENEEIHNVSFFWLHYLYCEIRAKLTICSLFS